MVIGARRRCCSRHPSGKSARRPDGRHPTYGPAVRGLRVSTDSPPDRSRHGEGGMPALIDLLHRFRRLGAPPGAPASGIGVPGQPGESAARELGQVFAAVDAIELEATAVRIMAEAGAAKIVADAGDEAARIRADGHLRPRRSAPGSRRTAPPPPMRSGRRHARTPSARPRASTPSRRSASTSSPATSSAGCGGSVKARMGRRDRPRPPAGHAPGRRRGDRRRPLQLAGRGDRRLLAATAYGERLTPGLTLAEAQRQRRGDRALAGHGSLAGWLPAPARHGCAPLVGWFELSNVDQRVAELDGAPSLAPFELGRLRTGAAARHRRAGSRNELRERAPAREWMG